MNLDEEAKIGAALKKLKAAKWEFTIHSQTGYWKDPETNQEHQTLEALRILEGRINQ